MVRNSPWKWLLPLALLYTGLNCLKPLMIDDTAYHAVAAQVAQRPLDPYGFVAYWWSYPEPANDVLAPALLPYWWSVAIRLFGEQPVLWKLWLLPFSVLFVWALHELFRRFARGLELPLVCLTVLSPTFLPSLNLMLDVPALALSLGAVAAFCRACDRDSFALAALAGVMAGLAMETKYTGFLAPGTMLLYAVCFRRLRLWPAAALLAVQVFVSWEFLLALLYGQSHFLIAAGPSISSSEAFWTKLQSKGQMLLPLVCNLAGVCPAVVLVALAALGARRWLIGVAGALAVAGYAVLACYSDDITVTLPFDALPFSPFKPYTTSFGMEYLVYGVSGVVGLAILAIMAARLARLPGLDVALVTRWRAHRAEWFLLLWLLLEVAGYFFLTPFPAVRRIMGVVVVVTLLAGCLAARTCRAPERRLLVWGAVAFGILLGFGFWTVDQFEAWTEKIAVDQTVREIADRGGGGTTWTVGHWGWQYYTGRAGMRPVVTWYRAGDPWYTPEEGPIPRPAPSRLQRGDWLVIPDDRLTQQRLVLERDCLEEICRFGVNDGLPLRTVMCFYAGHAALEHRPEQTRLEVTIYRVTRDFDPVSHR